ncbi:hypothetical protein [Lactiplantibacillus fabifermentans]|uniref:Uncharacterized protein n=2 Tax=Lactiplantibacillus fabifermentans TaxID=483011 RepID=A0A0R2NLL2_9LACO|nr:hypothetical protein [Lactiplantibacillus fabifermentans]ETY73139.1 hypothetical protein LFAB_13950 [Lactiplantibacillus fabifermentans T30PCM01]KRO25531.1 hypothetical protein DY78_GL001195 [Lactiplantibacillus fabifermentans DSM 21115]
MADTDSQIALTMTFTLRPPFKTHFLLLKDYIADVRIPARDGMLTTLIAKNIPMSPALDQLMTIFDDVQNPVYWQLHDQAVQEFFDRFPEKRPILPLDLLQVVLSTLVDQGMSDADLTAVMNGVFNRLQTNDFGGQAAQQILTEFTKINY